MNAEPKVTTAVGGERIKELRGAIADAVLARGMNDFHAVELNAALDEVERLRGILAKYEEAGKREGELMLHHGKMTADLATDRCRLIAENNCLQARAEKAEAELKLLKPERGNEEEDDDVALLGLEALASQAANPEIFKEPLAYVRARMVVARKYEGHYQKKGENKE